jgi:hypothetical protein
MIPPDLASPVIGMAGIDANRTGGTDADATLRSPVPVPGQPWLRARPRQASDAGSGTPGIRAAGIRCSQSRVRDPASPGPAGPGPGRMLPGHVREGPRRAGAVGRQTDYARRITG